MNSPALHMLLCVHAGWQDHPVSNRKFHFIFPGKEVLADPKQLPSLVS